MVPDPMAPCPMRHRPMGITAVQIEFLSRSGINALYTDYRPTVTLPGVQWVVQAAAQAAPQAAVRPYSPPGTGPGSHSWPAIPCGAEG